MLDLFDQSLLISKLNVKGLNKGNSTAFGISSIFILKFKGFTIKGKSHATGSFSWYLRSLTFTYALSSKGHISVKIRAATLSVGIPFESR